MKRVQISPAMFALLAGAASSAFAADVMWDNGSLNFLWDTTSANWNGAAWNNASGNGAIFGATGVGAITVNEPISVNSLHFTADGYTLNGPGSLTIANGTSTQTTGVVNVGTGVSAAFNVGVTSALGFQKIGGGTLTLNNACNFTSPGVFIDPRGNLRADLLVGGAFGNLNGGTLRIGNSSVLPSSTRVSIGTGFMDIGSNAVTIGALTFTNAVDFTPWNPTIMAAGNGVIGSGMLRVLGEINVLGATGGNAGNTVATNLDLGGGTQVVRVGASSSFGLSSALQFTGSLSNGSLFKSIGLNHNGVQASVDGMGLFGNNTYTGSTILNSGTTIATGTNATSLVRVAGQGGPGGSSFNLQGANGSILSASTVQAFGSAAFIIDNNAALGASGNNQPNIPAAQNNDRVRDDASLQLRDGSFTYRGFATAAASETIGSLSLLGGHNVVTLTPNGTGGTATVTFANDLTMAPRSTLQIASTVLGTTARMFVNGSVPAADATGIIRNVIGSNDFLTYNGTTGFTPFIGYATDFSTPGTNVTYAATGAVASSVNINALRNTSGAATTLTIGAGQTLGIDSGMIFNSGFGTATITGGALAFGSTAGALLSTGSLVLSGAVTGSNGLISARGTNTLSGDLSGLTGTINLSGGTLNLNTNTFSGDIHQRAGTFNINTSQTLAGQGAIRLGVAEAETDMLGTLPGLNISGAGANAVIGRDLIVDNGATNFAGAQIRYSLVPGLSPLSNSTGSQTWSGNIVLNTSLRLQGGGASATSTGSTNFTGAISGAGTFHVANGRANFAGNLSNAGGFNLGDQGFSTKITFSGTTTGSAPVTISGGNGNTLSYNAGSLPTGTLRVWNSSAATAPQIIPLENSTIANAIVLDGDAIANVGAGIIAEWSGAITGASNLSKIGTGELVLSGANSAHAGVTTVNAGTLRLNGSTTSAMTITTGASLRGVGSTIGTVIVNAGGLIAPGASVGTLSVGSLSLAGTLGAEFDMGAGSAFAADLMNARGTITLTSATLDLALLNPPSGNFGGATFILIDNDGADAVSGSFAQITGLLTGYSAEVNYAFSGVDSLGRVGDGNDIAVTLVPAPGPACLLTLGLATMARRRRSA